MLGEMGFRLLPYDTSDGTHDKAVSILEQIGTGTRSRVRTAPRSILPPPIPDLELPSSSSLLDFEPFELPADSTAYVGPVPVAARHREGPRRERVSEPPASPIEVFFSYSERNRELRDKLETHLASLRRKGVIRGWHEGEIGAGEERDKVLIEHLETAKVILLLISADFLASDFCYDVEMQKAILRHEQGEARVIPIILDACDWDWEGAPFRKLVPLPSNGRPVTSWANQSEAFTDIAKGIRKQIELLTQNPS
jgi:hypothetical protein